MAPETCSQVFAEPKLAALNGSRSPGNDTRWGASLVEEAHAPEPKPYRSAGRAAWCQQQSRRSGRGRTEPVFSCSPFLSAAETTTDLTRPTVALIPASDAGSLDSATADGGCAVGQCDAAVPECSSAGGTCLAGGRLSCQLTPEFPVVVGSAGDLHRTPVGTFADGVTGVAEWDGSQWIRRVDEDGVHLATVDGEPVGFVLRDGEVRTWVRPDGGGAWVDGPSTDASSVVRGSGALFARATSEYFKMTSDGWAAFAPPTLDRGPGDVHPRSADADDGVLVEGDYSGIHISDGSGWVDVQTPDLPPSPLPATRPAAVLWVRVASATRILLGLEEHGAALYDGSDFEILGDDIPCPVSVKELRETSDGTLVAQCFDGSAYRRNATDWEALPTLAEGRVFQDDVGVYGNRPEGLPAVYDGTRWTPLGVRNPTPRRLYEGIPDGATRPVALGPSAAATETELLRWTGTGWEEPGTPGPPWRDGPREYALLPRLTSDNAFITGTSGAWSLPWDLYLHRDGSVTEVDEPFGGMRLVEARSSNEIHTVAMEVFNDSLLADERYYIVGRDPIQRGEPRGWGSRCEAPRELTFAGDSHVVITQCPDYQSLDENYTNSLRVSDDNGTTWVADNSPTGWGFVPLGHLGNPWTGAAVFRQHPANEFGRLLREDAWNGTLFILDNDGWRTVTLPSSGHLPQALSGSSEDAMAIRGQSSVAYWDGTAWSTVEHRRLAGTPLGMVLWDGRLLTVQESTYGTGEPIYRTTLSCVVQDDPQTCPNCSNPAPVPPRPGTCSDGTLNGGESDIDCGGPCASCALGETCTQHWDCESRHCSDAPARTCVKTPGCRDGRFTPNEQCDDGNEVDDDWCSNRCWTAKCDDAVQNGDETAVDSGGYCAFPERDICRRAEVLTFRNAEIINGVWTYETSPAGLYAGASDAHTPSCGENGLDQAFRLELNEATQITLVASSQDEDDRLNPLRATSLSVTRDCDGAEVACVSVSSGAGGAEIRDLALEPGAYIVWIEGDSAQLADVYELTATYRWP